jgi:hypothetical protein
MIKCPSRMTCKDMVSIDDELTVQDQLEIAKARCLECERKKATIKALQSQYGVKK